MSLFKAANNHKAHPLEIGYSALGFGIGALFCLSGLMIDLKLREWRGLDAGLYHTFTATIMHGLALTSPLIMARIFLGFARKQRALRETIHHVGQVEQRMRDQALHDGLTGLHNRAYVAAALEDGIATSEWEARGARLFMLDLDEFKHINDTYGHRAGDTVLIETARRLASALEPGDIAVRLGGDEFLVVHFTLEEGGPQRFGERLVQAICQGIEIDGSMVAPGTSIGVAAVGTDGRTWSEVMRAADIALYRAKAEPVSAVVLYRPEMKVLKDSQAALEGEIKLGLARSEFELHYQPIHGAQSGAIRSFEALVRWNHPKRGLVPPSDFIPAAERSGLIVPLGRHLLKEACRTAAAWPKPVGVAVNLSPVQFRDSGLVAHVEEALAESGLAPGRLDLEITESLLLEASPRIRATIDGLRALGVLITMDDFGSGFSSLNNLRQFRFDRLKIDRSFTRGVAGGGDDAEIVRTIIALSKTLRMDTVLEGVETEGQLSFARDEGVGEVQGFYYARPMPAEKVEKLLTEREPDEVVGSAAA